MKQKEPPGPEVIGVLECGGVGGRIVALRADIDALNVRGRKRCALQIGHLG